MSLFSDDDGKKGHSGAEDGAPEGEAHAGGDEFRRYTYGEDCERPRAMLDKLRRLLSPA